MNRFESIIKDLDAIAIGSGPSARLLIGMDIPETCKLVGAGDVTDYLKVDYYAYGDSDHYCHVPGPPVIVYATSGQYEGNEHFPRKDNFVFFPAGEGDWHHGCSSGGMAIAIACILFKRVGLIGFDGYYGDGSKYDANGDAGQRQVIKHFKDRGINRLVSLMPVSIHNDLLIY